MIVIRRGLPRGRARRSSENDELFRALLFGANAVSSPGRTTWRPPTEVYATDSALVVVAEIAGMDREEIEILIEGDNIAIRGMRPDPSASEHRSYHEARIAYGRFAVDIHVPFAIDGSAATATYDNGFLRISIPREATRTITPRRRSDSATGDSGTDDAAGRDTER